MSIAQRKDGRYCVKYKFNGRWQQRTFKTKKEAKAFEAENNTEQAINEDLSVGEIIVAYLRSVPHHHHTVAQFKTSFFKAGGEGYFLFDRYPHTLNRRDLERFRENLRAKRLSNKTINTRTSMVRAALSWAVEQELITVNPWKNYRRLPIQSKPISVSMDAFKAIYNKAPEWLQWAMKTAFCLCLRPGRVELFGLKWSAFNFATNSVTLAQGKSGILKTVLPPLPYMQEAKERFINDRSKGIELVCTRKQKFIYNYHAYWANACERAGQRMRFYDIRHLAATQMLASGADIVSVAAQMGHQDCSMTGRVYAHALQSGQQKAGQALAF